MLHLWKNIIDYFFTFSLPDELYEVSSFTLKFLLKVYQSEVKLLSHVLLFVTPWTVFMDSLWPHGLPGFSVHGIFQARILEWVAISFSGDLPDPGIEPRSPILQADSLLFKPRGKPICGSKGQGKKKRGNPFGLSILDTDFCVYVSPILLIHPCCFNFFGTLCLCFEFSESLFVFYFFF